MPLHKEILSEEQVRLLPILQRFKGEFGLVGGTAIALHIGHRESIDFGLFPKDPSAAFVPAKLRYRFSRGALLGRVLVEEDSELTFMTTSGVKITFYAFDYAMPFTEPFERWIDIPDLLTLAAMKAFALGSRAKWKDYVDLYFILKDHFSLEQISQRADELFDLHFNAKLFREQLYFFDDMSHKEPVIFKPGFEVPEEDIKRALLQWSVS